MVRDGFFDHNNSSSAESLIRLCERAPWLIVDDLGAERLSDWAAEVLFRVFNARYASRAPTFVVSNVCPDDVAEARLRSRFLDSGLCQVVPNGAEDYRQLQGQGQRQRAPDFPNPCLDIDAASGGNGKRAREFGV
jgi:DNA replication protein DnaC